jgi:hypothetical protein
MLYVLIDVTYIFLAAQGSHVASPAYFSPTQATFLGWLVWLCLARVYYFVSCPWPSSYNTYIWPTETCADLAPYAPSVLEICFDDVKQLAMYGCPRLPPVLNNC